MAAFRWRRWAAPFAWAPSVNLHYVSESGKVDLLLVVDSWLKISQEGRQTVGDLEQLEILKQIDRLNESTREHHYEESRPQIEELYQRIKNLGEDAKQQVSRN